MTTAFITDNPSNVNLITLDDGRILLVTQDRKIYWSPGTQRVVWNDVVGITPVLLKLGALLGVSSFMATTRSPSQTDQSAEIDFTFTHTDGSMLKIAFYQAPNAFLKIKLNFTAGSAATYTLQLILDNVVDQNTGLYPAITSTPTSLTFSIYSVTGTGSTIAVPGPITFLLDWSDMTPAMIKITNGTFVGASFTKDSIDKTIIFSASAIFTTIGGTVVIDPFVDGSGGGNAGGQPADMKGSSPRLFRDSFDKVLGVLGSATGNMQFFYSNNPDVVSPTFTTIDLGANFSVAGNSTGCAFKENGGASDTLMVGWVGGITAVKFAQLTINRDASNNITGVTAGSILSITAGKPPTDISMWFMPSTGEVAVAWTENSTSGAKSAQTFFIRVAFGSPPTYKNLAGTATSKDSVGTNYGGAFTHSYCGVVQSTFDNAIWASWIHRDQLNYKETRGVLGGTFPAETVVHTISDNLGSPLDYRISMVSKSDQTPELVASAPISVGLGFVGLAAIYGVTGAAISFTKLDGSEFDTGLSNGNTSDCSLTKTPIFGSAIIFFHEFNIVPGQAPEIDYFYWDNSVWQGNTGAVMAGINNSGQNQRLFVEPTTYSTIRVTSGKPYSSSRLEVLYGARRVSDSVWEVHYAQIDLTKVVYASII